MSPYKDPDFSQRLRMAADARKAMLEKFRTKPGQGAHPVTEQQPVQPENSVTRKPRAPERKSVHKADEPRPAGKQTAREAEGSRQVAKQTTRAADKKGEQARGKASDRDRKVARKTNAATGKTKKR